MTNMVIPTETLKTNGQEEWKESTKITKWEDKL